MDDRYAVEVLKVLGEINEKLDILSKVKVTKDKKSENVPGEEKLPNKEAKAGTVKIKRKIKKYTGSGFTQ